MLIRFPDLHPDRFKPPKLIVLCDSPSTGGAKITCRMATGVAAQESLDNVPINALDKPIGMFNVYQTFDAPLG